MVNQIWLWPLPLHQKLLWSVIVGGFMLLQIYSLRPQRQRRHGHRKSRRRIPNRR